MTEPRIPQVLPTKKRAHYLERYSEADHRLDAAQTPERLAREVLQLWSP